MKESLLKVKRLLERKCIFMNNDCLDIEKYLEVVGSIDNEEAVNCIREMFKMIQENLLENVVDPKVFLDFGFFYNYAKKYEDNDFLVHKNNVKPIQDIVSVSPFIIGENGVEFDSNRSYIVTFEDFKTMLEEIGLTIEYSFEELHEEYRKAELSYINKFPSLEVKEKSKVRNLKQN